jgi:hypothetical protein
VRIATLHVIIPKFTRLCAAQSVRLLGDSARPMRLRPDRRHSLPAPARGFASAKAGVTTNALRRKASFRVPTLLGGNQS